MLRCSRSGDRGESFVHPVQNIRAGSTASERAPAALARRIGPRCTSRPAAVPRQARCAGLARAHRPRRRMRNRVAARDPRGAVQFDHDGRLVDAIGRQMDLRVRYAPSCGYRVGIPQRHRGRGSRTLPFAAQFSARSGSSGSDSIHGIIKLIFRALITIMPMCSKTRQQRYAHELSSRPSGPRFPPRWLLGCRAMAESRMQQHHLPRV